MATSERTRKSVEAILSKTALQVSFLTMIFNGAMAISSPVIETA